jgi:hypothetical protein
LQQASFCVSSVEQMVVEPDAVMHAQQHQHLWQHACIQLDTNQGTLRQKQEAVKKLSMSCQGGCYKQCSTGEALMSRSANDQLGKSSAT